MIGKSIEVAVVGGGIGGMAAAVALARKGIDVQVFEQASRIAEIGAGVFVMPNGVRALHQLGLGQRVSELGAPVGDGSAYCRQDGTVVAPYRTTDSHGDFRQLGMHRADLLGMLRDEIPRDSVRLDHRCVSVSQDGDTAVLHFETKPPLAFDAVIAADGIRSTLRSLVAVESEPVPSGFVAYRGLLPASDAPGLPREVARVWMGNNRHFVVFPVRAGAQLNYVGFVPSVAEHRETWSAPGDAEELRRSFEDFAPEVVEMVSAVRECYWWGLYDRAPLTTWTDRRLALLGDAAHPMLPHLGQGANQALEDAIALGEVLDGVAARDIPQALRLYQDIREPRTSRVQEQSRFAGSRYDSADTDLSRRDTEVSDQQDFKLWLSDYDAQAAARAARDRAQQR